MPDIDQQKQSILDKRVSPTGLTSLEIRIWWSDKLKEQSLFSARTTTKSYLDRVKELLADYQTTLGETAEGEPITQGLQRTRMQMLEKLNELGLVERDEDGNVIQGKMTNLGSAMRLNLIVKTNTELANSMRMKMVSQDPLQQVLNPAFEFIRNGTSKNPRDWGQRWNECASLCNWEGVAKGTPRMIALVNSPIWSFLGHKYADSIGTDMPPFCWNSNMGWETVSREECKELGLIE